MNLVLIFTSLFMVVMCRILGRDKHFGIGRKVGCRFELVSLNILTSFDGYVAIVSSETWHCQLGHTSFSRLSSSISSGHLASIDIKHFDCLSYKLEKHHALPFQTNESYLMPLLISFTRTFGDDLPPPLWVALAILSFLWMITLVIHDFSLQKIVLNLLVITAILLL